MAARSPFARLEAALAGIEPPFAVVDLDAFRANAADLARALAQLGALDAATPLEHDRVVDEVPTYRGERRAFL